MAMSDTRYAFIKQEIQNCIARNGGLESLKHNADVVNPMTTMWGLFGKVMADAVTPDAPERTTSYLPGFKIYRDDNGVELHDDDIKHALHKLGVELGLIEY